MDQIDIKKILEILPHRYPFLLVDKVLEVNKEESHIVAQKNVSVNEDFFNGHFPEAPIMPGVLIIEAMAQAGGILAHVLQDGTRKIAVLLKIDGVKFRTSVKPGDVLTLDCHMVHITHRAGRMKAEAKVGERLAASAEVTFAFVEKSQI